MSKVFTQLPIKGNIEKLPLGILTVDESGQPSGIMRDINYRKLSREETKSMRDEKFMQRHAMQWMARVICLVVESIDGVPVYATYAASGFKIIPEIVKEIAPLDVFFIFLGGHIYNFGYEIKGLEGKCPDCKKKQSFDVNIETLNINTDFDSNYHIFTVTLKDGVLIENPGTKEKILYTKIDFRMSTLGDALKFEEDYRPNGQGMFTEKVYTDCIYAVYNESGDQLDSARIKSIMPSVLKGISGLDSDLIDEAFNDNIPRIANELTEICKYCSEDLKVLIHHGFLFTQRRLD